MKRKTGPLAVCIQQAADLYSASKSDTREGVAVRCLLQGKLLTDLYLMPGEATRMTVQRLGEAVNVQARISASPLGQQAVNFEYDETGVGTVIDDRRVIGTLRFEGELDPAVVLYRPDLHSVLTQRQ
jgi:hypothetical protein